VDARVVRWRANGCVTAADGTRAPYDAVAVREDIVFVNLALTSRERESLTLVVSRRTGRVAAVHSVIQAEATEDVPQVAQTFRAGALRGIEISRDEPGPSRDLIGKRNIYRYSPQHLGCRPADPAPLIRLRRSGGCAPVVRRALQVR
jgi:hypothetical protein